jgi:hypothetical protein
VVRAQGETKPDLAALLGEVQRQDAVDADDLQIDVCGAALVAFGYDMSDVAVEEMLAKKILIRQYMMETDLHPFVKGASFD